jgi:hypothetical protein
VLTSPSTKPAIAAIIAKPGAFQPTNAPASNSANMPKDFITTSSIVTTRSPGLAGVVPGKVFVELSTGVEVITVPWLLPSTDPGF